jgi:hypothetical protein
MKEQVMSDQPTFDLQAAHHHFAADCFNLAWNFIDKPARTSEEDDEMLLLSLTSTWHWLQHADRSPTNLSVSYWQNARVFTLLGQVENARHFALRCLQVSQGEGIAPFYLGYAYEALARTEMLAGDREKMKEYLLKGRELAARVIEKEEKSMLLADFDTIL